MKSTQFLFLVTAALFFPSHAPLAQGLSFKTLNACKENYSEILESKSDSVKSVNELPPGVYLARSVTQGLEKPDEKYFSYQSLLEVNKNVPDFCFRGEPASAIRTQAFFPTLIDKTEAQTFGGHTFWSLSSVIDKLTGAVHSKRSLIPQRDYKEALRNQGYKVTATQKNHTEFQIRLERNIASWKETIVITYDQF